NHPPLHFLCAVGGGVFFLNTLSARGGGRPPPPPLAALDEHPSELVRDRYLVPVADRCKLDPALLRATVQRFRAARRGDAASAGGEDAAGVTAAGPADPSIAEQVLLLRVHAPETFPPWVSPGLFESDVHQRILVALANGATLRDLRDAAPQEVAPAVARLAVCDPPACAEPVIGRLVFDAAGRWISATTRRARETGDAALGRRLGEVQLACDELRGSNWSPAAAERLARRLTAVVTGTGTPSPEPGGPTEDGEAETPTRLLSASGEEHFDEGLPASGDEEGFVGNRSGTGTPQR
ncbi:MAG: hypothetical protein OXP08_00970, partial [bacterium]|nr:hypothetical protein [bacterium]